MAGRWPSANEQVNAQLTQARDDRDAAIEQAEQQLLQVVAKAVDDERVTISDAAGLVGAHRVTLSRALNAGETAPRSGGGRSTPPDASTRRELVDAAIARDEAVLAAGDAFTDLVAKLTDARDITVSGAAQVLDVHRTTLIRALKERAARRGDDEA